MIKKTERVALSSMGTNRPKFSALAMPQDPISRMAMKVSVFDIEPYHKNPRQVTNEYYEEIKASIKQKGLEQAFSITRRPGDLKYTIRAGGNTRLRALRELYNETKDAKFLMVDVFFEPYTVEQDLLISHLTENDLRGNLTLLDRARGVVEVKKMIESERGCTLSKRELSDALRESGYSLSHTVVSLLIYAIEHVYPIIPELLEEGAGKSVIERIRKIENQLKEVWAEFELPIAGFKAVFNESLVDAFGHSEKSIDNDEIFRAFETEAALSAGIPINDIRIKIADITAHKVKSPVIAIESDEAPDPQTILPDSLPYDPQEEKPIQEATTLTEPGDSTPEITQESKKFSDVFANATEAEFQLSGESELVASESSVLVSDDSDDLELLRKVALDQAIVLANEADIADLIITTNRGYGFALADMPLEIHFSKGGLDDASEEFQKVWQVWYQLFIVCGASLPNDVTHYSDFIAHDNDLKALVENRFFDDASELGQYLITTTLRFNLLIQSSDKVFNKVDQLVKIVRKIESAAKDLNVDLWEGV